MKIALDISPLSTGHKYRGTGFYVKHLKDAFEAYHARNHEFIFFTNKKDLPKDIDIVHYPYFDPFSLSVPLFSKQKTVVTVLDLTPIIFPDAFPAGIKGNVKWQLQKFALKHISGIVTDSNSAKKDIHKIINMPEEKIMVTYLAAGDEFKRIKDKGLMVKKKYGLPEKFALYVGDVTWNKNVSRVVEAAKKTNIPLVMVGKALANKTFDATNPWNKDLVQVQKEILGSPIFHVLGFIPDQDLVALYNCATLFIMPSFYEGFGLPVLEAMACGCPVITSNKGSLAEVASDAAYIVDPYSTNAIEEGLQKVFQDSQLQKNLAQKGLIQANKFSWKKTAEETIFTYKSILSKK